MPVAALDKELPDPRLYAELAVRHGHYCPMSTLGLRLGAVARPLVTGADQLSYAARTCAVDGICLALDLTSLSVSGDGEHRLDIYRSEDQLHIGLLPRALELAASYRHLSANEQEGLLETLRMMPASELIFIRVEESA